MILPAVKALLRDALEVYSDDPTADRVLRDQLRRLDEPVRIAIAGMTKAGKSTLLNAVVGREVAVTDVGESTRMITWYRYGRVPRVTAHPVEGRPFDVPLRDDDGRLVFDLGTTRAEDVVRLEIEWPADILRGLTLIDTPGLASLTGSGSARSTAFLVPAGTTPEADAVVYVLRHLHIADLTFLQSFRDATAGRDGVVNAIAVLSRADEIGAGRIDSLLSANDIAERYRGDDLLRSVALGVVAVAGLVAESACTLSDSEFDALTTLAELDRVQRERLLMSADRFTRPLESAAVPVDDRVVLLKRLGLFGIRLALVLVRGGARDRESLARELARRSGVDDLRGILDRHFRARSEYLRSRTALIAVDGLLRERPVPGSPRLESARERIVASAHEFTEIRLLFAPPGDGLNLPPALNTEARRLVGGEGTAPRCRLGLADDASDGDVLTEATAALDRWRRLGEDPLIDRPIVEICRIVTRSCEGILAMAAGAEPPTASRARATPRSITRAEPGVRTGRESDDERRAG